MLSSMFPEVEGALVIGIIRGVVMVGATKVVQTISTTLILIRGNKDGGGSWRGPHGGFNCCGGSQGENSENHLNF